MKIFILDTKRDWSALLTESSARQVEVEDATTFEQTQDGDIVVLHSGDTTGSELTKLLNLSPTPKIRIGFVSGGNWPPRADKPKWEQLASKYPIIKLEGFDHFTNLDTLLPTVVAKAKSWLRELVEEQEEAGTRALQESDYLLLAKRARAWRQVLLFCLPPDREEGASGRTRLGKCVAAEFFEPLTKPDAHGHYLPEILTPLEEAVRKVKLKAVAKEHLFPEELTSEVKKILLPAKTPETPITVEDIRCWLREFRALNCGVEPVQQMEWAEFRDVITFCASTIGTVGRQCEVPFERRRWLLEADQSRSVIWHESLTKDLVYRLIDGALQANLSDLGTKWAKRDEVLLKNLPTHTTDSLNKNFAFGLERWFGKMEDEGILASMEKLLASHASPPSGTAMRLSVEGKREIAIANQAMASIGAFFGALRESKRPTAKSQSITVAEQWRFWESCFQLARYHDKSKGFLANWKQNFERSEILNEQ